MISPGVSTGNGDGKGVLVDQVGPFYRVCSALDSVGEAGKSQQGSGHRDQSLNRSGRMWMWKAAWEFSLLLKILGIF